MARAAGKQGQGRMAVVELITCVGAIANLWMQLQSDL